MKKLILLILLIHCVCYGDAALIGLEANNSTQGGTCSSGTVDTNADFLEHSTGDSNHKLKTAGAQGQSFQTSSSGSIYSITVYVSAIEGGGGTCTMRWGPDEDLTSTYYQEIAISGITTTGDYEFIFTDNDSITASTTYYFGAITSAVDTLYFRKDTADGYPNGTLKSGLSWNMSTTTSGSDLLFEVKLCD